MRRIALAAFTMTAVVSACSDMTTTPASPDAASLAISSASQQSVSGETIYGLSSDNRLISFSSAKPNQNVSDVEITGLAAGETVIGIDFRPSDLNGNATDDTGKLYGVTDASRLYVIDPATGAASSPVSLSVAVTGSAIGIGFNPVPDRLRIHTTTDQNLRINVDNGAVTADTALTYRAGDVNFGVDPQVVATGYTNNDNNPATGTALFAIDANTDALVAFPAATGGPNGGRLATVGSLGIDVGLSAGFDISLGSGTAYAAVATSASGKSTLYSIYLMSGAATKLGMLAQTSSALLSIAVKP